MKLFHIVILQIIFIFLCSIVLFVWWSHNYNCPTGDEPHYLVMARGLVDYFSFEQTRPYQDEFQRKNYFKGWPENEAPSPQNTHTKLGTNGLFNVHNIGLPIIISIPLAICGVVGVKLLLIFIISCVVFFCGRIVQFIFAGHSDSSYIIMLLMVCAITFGMPFIPASNQVYPDLIAGLISLISLWWLLIESEQKKATEIIIAFIVAGLPWLQIKFGLASAILLIALSVSSYRNSKKYLPPLSILLIGFVSCFLLISYNFYAFQNLFGPYGDGSIEFSSTSVMVFLGLLLDQNHGILLSNPIFLFGVTGLGIMFRYDRYFFYVWFFVFISLIIPNSMHPNWYGGFSFSGRFAWSAATIFIIPTIFGLYSLYNYNKRNYIFTILIVIIIQGFFFFLYSTGKVSLYNVGIGDSVDWPYNYSIFYKPIYSVLPMLYDTKFAYKYYPNYIWGNFILFLLFVGFINIKNRFKLLKNSWIALFLLCYPMIISPYIQNDKQLVFSAAKLPSQTGRVLGDIRVASYDKDKEGFLSYGPYSSLISGSYLVSVEYSDTGKWEQSSLIFDIYNTQNRKQIDKYVLPGTNGEIKKIAKIFVHTGGKSTFEFRLFWNKKNIVQLKNITLNRL